MTHREIYTLSPALECHHDSSNETSDRHILFNKGKAVFAPMIDNISCLKYNDNSLHSNYKPAVY